MEWGCGGEEEVSGPRSISRAGRLVSGSVSKKLDSGQKWEREGGELRINRGERQFGTRAPCSSFVFFFRKVQI
jgi:hypothetical protein